MTNHQAYKQQAHQEDHMERFTKDHEWISIDGDVGTVGITKHAAEQLGDVVFVEIPALGTKVKAGDRIAVVESVKAASDIYAPVSGEIVGGNEELVATPAGVNEHPESAGWFFKIKLSDKKELDGMMDRAAYDAFVETGA
jgi:glycine cleavage system H protein